MRVKWRKRGKIKKQRNSQNCETSVPSDSTCIVIPWESDFRKVLSQKPTGWLLSRLRKLTAFVVMTILQLSYRGIKMAFRMHNILNVVHPISSSSIHCGDYRFALTGKFSFHPVCIWRVRGRAIPQSWEIYWQTCKCQRGAIEVTQECILGFTVNRRCSETSR